MGKIEKEFEKQMDMQEPYSEMSDESISYDRQTAERPNYPSSMMPEDYFEYKRFVNLPEAQAEFEGKIDKDVVFANLSGTKPSLEELRFQIGTIELFEGEFVEEKEVEIIDSMGNKMIDTDTGEVLKRKILVFDEAFRSSLNFLKAEFKFATVASRALGGTERASMLDITTNSRINKEFSKKKQESKKFFGTGGM